MDHRPKALSYETASPPLHWPMWALIWPWIIVLAAAVASALTVHFTKNPRDD